MGYPSHRSEMEMLRTHGKVSPLENLRPVVDAATVRRMIEAVREVYVADSVHEYIVALAAATRESEALRLGASPRATLHVLRAARAYAVLAGRDHVLPDDVQAVLIPVLAHRILTTGETQASRRSAADVLSELIHRVRVPVPRAS